MRLSAYQCSKGRLLNGWGERELNLPGRISRITRYFCLPGLLSEQYLKASADSKKLFPERY
jgi:hypothetical protein